MGRKVIIQRAQEPCKPMPWTLTKATVAGDTVRLMSAPGLLQSPCTRKINQDLYVDLRTGEAKEYSHISNRSESPESIRHSMERLRDLINCNVTAETVQNCLWVTLTYRENMTDTKRLHQDWKKFWQKFERYLAKENLKKPEYITVIEPQARGAWHIHGFFIFPDAAPYISNNGVFEPLWGQGFTKAKRLKSCDNVGAYFTAYLTDLPVEDVSPGTATGFDTVEKIVNSDGIPEKKKFVKGARLKMYPPGCRLYRCSRGVKRPVIDYDDYQKEKEKTGASGKTPVFSSDYLVLVCDSDDVVAVVDDKSPQKIHREYYNLNR